MNATTTRHVIIERYRRFAASYASITDFTFDEGTATDAQVLLDEAGWSPYCLDDENRRVLFAKTPEDVNLRDAPFVYTVQFEQAQEAILIPYDALIDLTTDLRLPNTMFIYSTGRCGSTLMNQILNQLDGVYSLSEPDVFTNIIFYCDDPARREEMIALLRALTLTLYPRHRKETIDNFAIKFRSMTAQIADFVSEAVPEAKNIFMYREGISWANSFYRFFSAIGLPMVMNVDGITNFWGMIVSSDEYLLKYIPDEFITIEFSQFAALFWVFHLQHIFAAIDDGIPFMLIRYEELNNAREETLRELFNFCNLPEVGVAQAIEGFEQDSQHGTILAQQQEKLQLSDEQIDLFVSTLAKHPTINSPDFMF